MPRTTIVVLAVFVAAGLASSGNGNLVHASSYWGKTVERPMRYIDGYWGARRLI